MPIRKDSVSKEECAEHHKALLTELTGIRSDVHGLSKRLFVDNGTLSIQTRLDRHEMVIRSLIWVVCTVATASVASLVAVLFVVVKGAFVK